MRTRIFAENRRNRRLGLHHLRCVTSSSALHIARYLLREVSTPQKWCDTPLGIVSHRHICAIPHFATDRATPPPSHKNKHERVLRYYRYSIARYEKYRPDSLGGRWRWRHKMVSTSCLKFPNGVTKISSYKAGRYRFILAHRNRSDFCDLQCLSRTPEIASDFRDFALRFKGAMESR